MKRPVAIILVGLAIVSLQAFGHTQLSGSEPADTAEVSSPSEIVLEFSADVRLTSVDIRTVSGEAQKLGQIPQNTGRRFVIPIESSLAPGEYLVAWRSIGADTHVVAGEFRFTVAEA